MGVVGAVIGTLGAAFMQGRAQQQQAEAAARREEYNAAVMQANANKEDQRARAEAENNKIATENARRRELLRIGKQRAAIGASGITASGSAATALADTRYAIDQETGMMLYNGRQRVDDMFQRSTDYTNQELQHRANASNYRAAGKQAMMNSMLMGAFSLAGNLYSASSSAAMSGTDKAVDSGVGGATGSTFTSTRSQMGSYFNTDFGYKGKKYDVGAGIGRGWNF